MTFHPDFWVATATAAPVIALAAIVSSGTVMRQATAMAGSPDDPLRPYGLVSSWLLLIAAAVNYPNIFMQAYILYWSLKSLSAGANGNVSPLVAMVLTIVGVVLVFVSTFASGVVYLATTLLRKEVGQSGTDDNSGPPGAKYQQDSDADTEGVAHADEVHDLCIQFRG